MRLIVNISSYPCVSVAAGGLGIGKTQADLNSKNRKLELTHDTTQKLRIRLHVFLYNACLITMLGSYRVDAQGTHELSISIPRLILVRLNDTHPLRFDLIQHSTNTQDLAVSSSGVWTLAASFVPCRQSDSPRLWLSAEHHNGAQLLRPYPRVLTTKNPTLAWTNINLDLHLQPPISTELCQSLLIYTFIQP